MIIIFSDICCDMYHKRESIYRLVTMENQMIQIMLKFNHLDNLVLLEREETNFEAKN
jgi:hypothetical protein